MQGAILLLALLWQTEVPLTVEGGIPAPIPLELGIESIALSDSAVAEMQDLLLTWYLERGYPFASIGFAVVSGDTLKARIVPGRHASLEGVRFSGLNRTRPSILIRQLDLEEGDPYSREEVVEWRGRLERLAFIQWVGRTELTLGPMGNLLLIQEIEEAPGGHFAASMGYAGSGKGSELEGGGEILSRNLLGTGRELELAAERVEWGGVNASLRYREPWILGTRLSAELKAAQEVPESSWVSREAELLLIWDMYTFRTSAGAGEWRGYRPDLPDQSYTYGIVGLGTSLGRMRRQGWEGLEADLQARIGKAQGTDTLGSITQASAYLDGRMDWYPGLVGAGIQVLAGGIFEGQWIDGRLWRLGGQGSLRGYPKSSFVTGRFVVARPELSVGETATRAYVFVDLGALDTGSWWRYPVGGGVGVRGSAGLFSIDTGIGVPLREGIDQSRLYVRAVAEIF